MWLILIKVSSYLVYPYWFLKTSVQAPKHTAIYPQFLYLNRFRCNHLNLLGLQVQLELEQEREQLDQELEQLELEQELLMLGRLTYLSHQ